MTTRGANPQADARVTPTGEPRNASCPLPGQARPDKQAVDAETFGQQVFQCPDHLLRRWQDADIQQTVINQALTRNQKHQPEPADSHNLTARQLEILRLIVRGKSTREIANGLGLSIKTVETHRSQIMKRLQIYDVAGLVLFAVREQIISLDD